MLPFKTHKSCPPLGRWGRGRQTDRQTDRHSALYTPHTWAAAAKYIARASLSLAPPAVAARCSSLPCLSPSLPDSLPPSTSPLCTPSSTAPFSFAPPLQSSALASAFLFAFALFAILSVVVVVVAVVVLPFFCSFFWLTFNGFFRKLHFLLWHSLLALALPLPARDHGCHIRF